MLDGDWHAGMSGWARVLSGKAALGAVKLEPADFVVVEQMEVQPSGSGEHTWLNIRKTKLNTEQVARALARFAGIAYRDVGYSGLKDFFAVTEQWFSVWHGGKGAPDWDKFELSGTRILQVARHRRKLRRGTHRANQFRITVRDLRVDRGWLQDALELAKAEGIPNYFGSQRFGRQASNMKQVQALFAGQMKVKNRSHRGLLYSAARAWLFNTILSARVAAGSWNTLHTGEPANLDGSASVFISQAGRSDKQRLRQLDIHPTAPLWGEFRPIDVEPYLELHCYETKLLKPYQELTRGLIESGLSYQRRATRCRVRNLDWQLERGSLQLQFELDRGQYATSLLRELVAQ